MTSQTDAEFIKDSHMNLKIRKYGNYNEYLEHQGSKLRSRPEKILPHDIDYEEIIKKRYSNIPLKGKTTLCLGARLGGEVRGFKSLGAMAKGRTLMSCMATFMILRSLSRALLIEHASVAIGHFCLAHMRTFKCFPCLHKIQQYDSGFMDGESAGSHYIGNMDYQSSTKGILQKTEKEFSLSRNFRREDREYYSSGSSA